MYRSCCWLVPGLVLGWIVTCAVAGDAGDVAMTDVTLKRQTEILGTLALTGDKPIAGGASIREHAVAWHPGKQRFYLVGDVIPLRSPRHPNTYETELHLWSSPDLRQWTYHGVAVPQGEGDSYDAHGVASPSGMVFHDGRLWVPFSARRTAAFTHRGIGLAWSGSDPEDLPWQKTAAAISDTPGEDDDPALVMVPGDPRIHLYHRTTAGGYHIVHTASRTPQNPASWAAAARVTTRPKGVRAQELTGAVVFEGAVHLFVIEQGTGVGGIKISHLMSPDPAGNFLPASTSRYLEDQPGTLAYGGHFTPVMRGGELVAAFWTVKQQHPRYGLQGHAMVFETKTSESVSSSLVFLADYSRSMDSVEGRDTHGKPVPGTVHLLEKPVFDFDTMAHTVRGLTIGADAASVGYATAECLPAGKGTLELTVKPLDWQGDDEKVHMLLQTMVGGRTKFGKLFVYKYKRSGMAVYFEFSDQGKKVFLHCPVADWQAGSWHHLALSYELPGRILFYVDGRLADEAAVDRAPPWPKNFCV
ncbi:MAG: hypothetical protein KAI66_05035, partial [Lentisphaeria bacterium]|nr:hypothetical protein [Lentisphaeria bacterium]